jgi:hypothetical protein
MSVSVYLLAVVTAGTILTAGFCWRVFVGSVARQAATKRQGPAAARVSAEDFGALVCLYAAADAVQGSANSTLLIRAYHQALRGICALSPYLASWTEKETMVCARYMAARVERRVAHNSLHMHSNASVELSRLGSDRKTSRPNEAACRR